MRAGALLEATVEAFDQHGNLIEKVNDQQVSRKVQLMRQNDQMKALMGDGQARVSIGLDEHIGGPYGYSGVKLRVNVTIACDQNVDTVTKAQGLALDQCMSFIEDNIKVTYDLLCAHLKANYRREE